MHHSANARQHHRGLLLCRMATFIRCRVLSSFPPFLRVSSFAPPTTFFPSAKRLSCHAETPRRDPVIYRPRWLACHALKDDPLPTTIPSIIFTTPFLLIISFIYTSLVYPRLTFPRTRPVLIIVEYTVHHQCTIDKIVYV